MMIKQKINKGTVSTKCVKNEQTFLPSMLLDNE